MDTSTQFFLFGTPIAMSPSPTLHNTGFKFHNLPYNYSLCDTGDIGDVVAKLKLPSTAGGSVTIPHKQAILPHVDLLSPSAQAIGAVNTVIKTEDNKLFGDNTDWIAIRNLTKLRVSSAFPGKELSQLKGLIVGAGGTAYAACCAIQQLGMPFTVWNRTLEKAEELSKKFGGTAISDLSQLPKLSVDVVIGTVPPTAKFELPENLLKPNLVVIELVYSPRYTPLVKQAKDHKCVVVEGSELLFEQGIAQFEIFTKHKAPKKEIAHAMVYNHNNGALTTDTPTTFAELLAE